MRVLVFDTETSGLPAMRGLIPNMGNLDYFPHIMQFSFIVCNVRTGYIAHSSDSIIKIPENIKVSPKSIELHGVTREISLERGIDVMVAIEEFLKYAKTCSYIVAHNMEFDWNMILVEIMRTFTSNSSSNKNLYLQYIDEFYKLKSKLYCTMQESVELCNIQTVNSYTGETFTKYPTLCELYETLFNTCRNKEKLHNSLYDVLICLKCFCKMKGYNLILDETFEKFLQ